MLPKLSRWLYRFASGKTILAMVAGFVIFMVLTLALLPILLPETVGIISLDDPVFYTPEQLLWILDGWGNTVRTMELWFHLTWDVIVPIWTFLIVGAITSWLLVRSFSPESKWRNLNLIGLVSVFDLLENFSLVGLILFFPFQPNWLAWLKTGFTMTKYASLVLIILVILLGLILSLKNKFKIRE